MRAIEELRDPWALAIAEASAFSAYLFGGRDWQVALTAFAVLSVRAIAGLLMPVPPSAPTPVLTPGEYLVARLITQGQSRAQIAKRLRVTRRAVDRIHVRILVKIGGTNEDIARWVGTPHVPEPSPRHWYERTLVRGTLAGAGLISLVWTLYNIAKAIWPQWFAR